MCNSERIRMVDCSKGNPRTGTLIQLKESYRNMHTIIDIYTQTKTCIATCSIDCYRLDHPPLLQYRLLFMLQKVRMLCSSIARKGILSFECPKYYPSPTPPTSSSAMIPVIQKTSPLRSQLMRMLLLMRPGCQRIPARLHANVDCTAQEASFLELRVLQA